MIWFFMLEMRFNIGFVDARIWLGLWGSVNLQRLMIIHTND